MTETKTKAPMSDTWRGKRRARRRGGRKDILVKAVAVEEDFLSVFLTSIDVGEDAEGDTTEERKESAKGERGGGRRHPGGFRSHALSYPPSSFTFPRRILQRSHSHSVSQAAAEEEEAE